MKLEFLPDGAEECPLIRLYDFEAAEIDALCEACRGLADGGILEFPLHAETWVESLGGCELTLQISDRDIGVLLPAKGRRFVLAQQSDWWREAAGRIQPFAAGRGGFAWLSAGGDVRVLVSHSGLW